MRTFIVFCFIQLASCASVPNQENALVEQENALVEQENALVEQDDALEREKRSSHGISFQGCFGGSPSFIKSRTVSNNINRYCAEFCRDNGFVISATRGSFCGCTNTLLSPQLARPDTPQAAGAGTKCSIRCPGVLSTGSCQGDECCGGAAAYSVYVVGQIDVMKQVLRRVADTLRANNAQMLKKEFGETPFRYIMQDSTGKCFNQEGGSALPWDNTRIKVGYGCDEPRYWYRMLSDGSIQHVTSGKCLRPYGGSAVPHDNTQLVLHSGCHQDRLRFEITSDGMIRHKSSNKCLKSTGSMIVFHSCRSENSKKFTLKSTASRSLNSVRQTSSGKCWHPRGGSAQPSDNTDLVIHSGCGAPPNWFEMLSDGSIRHMPSGKCLHPHGGSLYPSDNTKLVIHSGCGERSLQFRLLSNGCIQHKSSGKYLHPYRGAYNPSENTEVVIHSGCTNDNRLKWYFVHLGIPALPDFIIRTVGDTISSNGNKERKECSLESSATTEKTFTCSGTENSPSLLMEFKSMTRELEHGLGKTLTPLGQYDSELDNTHSASENVMTKSYSVSDQTSNMFHTEAGVSLDAKFGREATVDVGVATVSATSEITVGGFFSAGYQHETTSSKTETIDVEITVPAHSRGFVNLFQESYPLEIKWRALMFAKGTLHVTCAGLTKRFHVSEVLTYDQRKLYAFGTINFGERDKILAVVKTVDINGDVIQSITTESDV